MTIARWPRSTSPSTGAALDDTRERTIDPADHRLDVSDGLALALDRELGLLAATSDLEAARTLLGAEAGIEDVCTDLEGRLCLQWRDRLGARLAHGSSRSGKAEALAANDSPRGRWPCSFPLRCSLMRSR